MLETLKHESQFALQPILSYFCYQNLHFKLIPDDQQSPYIRIYNFYCKNYFALGISCLLEPKYWFLKPVICRGDPEFWVLVR